MSNLYQSLESSSFKLNRSKGMNKRKSAKKSVVFVGTFDPFTIETVYKHYDMLASNLKVYPVVYVHAREKELEGGFAGHYHSDEHKVEIVDQYYIVSILAHEMRHAFQAIYFPEKFYETSYRNAYQYLASEIERDAREYAIDYCKFHNLLEEKNALIEYERQVKEVIANRMTPQEIGLSSKYFLENPMISISQQNSRRTIADGQYEVYEDDYNEDEDLVYEGQYTKSKSRLMSFVKGFVGFVVVGFILITLIGVYIGEEELKEKHSPKDQNTYIINTSATDYVVNDQLIGLSAQELRLARNEIYARHGFIFGAEDLQEYFTAQSWYVENNEYSDLLLSEIEHENIYLIMEEENKRK